MQQRFLIGIVALLCWQVMAAYAQELPQLVSPIDGEYGKDFFLIHYIDQDTSDGIRDPFCGTKTYDGHLGHDFPIRSFREMDSGVTVLAAHDGVVVKVVDGLFDRNKEDTVFGYGNYVVIQHESGLATVYAHLKKHSIRVKFGDYVYAGEPIAQVGSSGRSSDPHLHFELWYDDMLWWQYSLVNPFAGPCSQGENLWADPFPYDTSLIIIGTGLLDHIPTLAELKEHPETQTIFRHTDTAICFWIHLHGVRQGDSLRVVWIAPYDITWFTYTTYVDSDKWYYYWWSHMPVPSSGTEGIWTVRFYRNDALVYERPFRIAKTVSGITPEASSPRLSAVRITPAHTILQLDGCAPATTYQIYDVGGRVVAQGTCSADGVITIAPLASGRYWLALPEGTFSFVVQR